ncbi:hypothetical protein [uncultured Acetobacteroides sp.]|uniref:gliding motility lipoprotein GldB n=1 Tax=uncultured Acetobacteroides sp. TaxID=1760811 RepID=UPI0029F45C53|nr:hypothetical protein [uncultured Acetobacteroides sp.]
MKKLVLLSVMAIAIIGVGCHKSKTGAPQAADVKPAEKAVDVKILRFDKDLASLNVNNLAPSIPILKKKYGSFIDLYSDGILGIGKTSDPEYLKGLHAFLTYPVVREAFSASSKAFTPEVISSIEKELSAAFTLYQGTFPNKTIPHIFFTYVAGFNQSVMLTDDALGIGLDKYLGAKYVNYPNMGFPRYLTAKMVKERIPVDVIYAWANSDFPIRKESEPLLSHIVYQGKLMYLVSQMLPNATDTLVFGFTKKQMKWCTKNEKMMWNYLVGQSLLFNSEGFVRTKFIDEAPFTNVFAAESPGRAAVWLGFRIVSDYMRNTKSTLADLMKENDFQKILTAAKYRP